MNLRDILTIEVLECGISDMILDNLTDLEEVVMGDIHIRQTQDNNYKIYIIDGEELFFNTYTNYKTEDMKKYEKCFNSFFKAFINAMKNSERINEDFVMEIILEMIIHSFKQDKDTLIKYINGDNIKEYIKQGIKDGLEDIIYRSQTEIELQSLYQDYTFNYKPWHIVIEEEDMEELEAPDREWIESNGWTVGSNINEDNLIINNDEEEIERFEKYLKSKGSLINIEKIAIRFYVEEIVYPYSFDYINFINYIMGEDIVETDDEEVEY